MLEIGFFRENRDRIIAGLKVRNFKEMELVDEIFQLDEKRRSTQTELDSNLATRNQLSKEIGNLYKTGKRDEAEAMKSEVATLKDKGGALEDTLKSVSAELEELLYKIPNIPHESVPPGTSEEDNEVYRNWEKDLPQLGEGALPHWELAQKYNIFDLELGVKITGAGFPVFQGKGARLQRALINFFLDEASRAGYLEIVPPLLVNEDTARATGQLPDKEGQMYYVEKDNLYLIPTAEVPVTNIYRDVILQESDFPIKLTGYTPCFRREAGSYGAHVRGLNRVHQFDKVEIVQIQHPDKSYDTLQEMLAHVSGLMEKLELPYRILRLCGADIGFTSALTFDFEVYSAAQQRWLEVSSVSNFETYQANRLKLRFRDGKSTRLAHTLNGSALALARIIAALLENNQTPEGIKIPKALQTYTGFDLLKQQISLIMGSYMGYIIITGIFSLIGGYLSNRLKSKFKHYSQVPMTSGRSGREIAQAMLDYYGIDDVKIEEGQGFLSDHYNPLTKTVKLSPAVYRERSVAAAAVAAHECGHAVQHANAYVWLKLRSAIVPVVNLAAKAQQFLLLFALGAFGVNGSPTLMLITLATFGITALFSLVTLPVEFDASQRALAWLDESRAAKGAEYEGAKDALWWAAMTYVSAALSALVMFLYFLLRYQAMSRR